MRSGNGQRQPALGPLHHRHTESECAPYLAWKLALLSTLPIGAYSEACIRARKDSKFFPGPENQPRNLHRLLFSYRKILCSQSSGNGSLFFVFGKISRFHCAGPPFQGIMRVNMGMYIICTNAPSPRPWKSVLTSPNVSTSPTFLFNGSRVLPGWWYGSAERRSNKSKIQRGPWLYRTSPQRCSFLRTIVCRHYLAL